MDSTFSIFAQLLDTNYIISRPDIMIRNLKNTTIVTHGTVVAVVATQLYVYKYKKNTAQQHFQEFKNFESCGVVSDLAADGFRKPCSTHCARYDACASGSKTGNGSDSSSCCLPRFAFGAALALAGARAFGVVAFAAAFAALEAPPPASSDFAARLPISPRMLAAPLERRPVEKVKIGSAKVSVISMKCEPCILILIIISSSVDLFVFESNG